jgi:hypothetical protein
MAKTNAGDRVASTRNPFMGKSVAEMKKIYDDKYRGKDLSAAQLSKVADQMQAAKKSLPTAKAKPAAKKPAAKKPAVKPKAKAKPTAAQSSRFYSSSSGGQYSTAKDRFYSSSSGTKKSPPKKRTPKGRAVTRRK